MIPENILILFLMILWLGVIILLFLDRKNGKVKYTVLAGMAVHGIVLIIRAVVSKHIPFSNIYETLIFFSFLYTVKLVLLKPGKTRHTAFLLTPVVVLLLVAFLMPGYLKEPVPLSPALRSFWIYLHVPLIFFGYVSILSAFILSVYELKNHSSEAEAGTVREVKLALFFTAAGIISGSFWAWQSWADFWSWDPKETWALITWLLLIPAVHIKKSPFRTAVLGAAVFAMFFTYFGVTYLLPGLHSYF